MAGWGESELQDSRERCWVPLVPHRPDLGGGATGHFPSDAPSRNQREGASFLPQHVGLMRDCGSCTVSTVMLQPLPLIPPRAARCLCAPYRPSWGTYSFLELPRRQQVWRYLEHRGPRTGLGVGVQGTGRGRASHPHCPSLLPEISIFPWAASPQRGGGRGQHTEVTANFTPHTSRCRDRENLCVFAGALLQNDEVTGPAARS